MNKIREFLGKAKWWLIFKLIGPDEDWNRDMKAWDRETESMRAKIAKTQSTLVSPSSLNIDGCHLAEMIQETVMHCIGNDELPALDDRRMRIVTTIWIENDDRVMVAFPDNYQKMISGPHSQSFFGYRS